MIAAAKPTHSGEDGFIIVAVLWILAALAALVSIYALFVTNTATAIAASNDAVQADALASAGVELAAYQLIGLPEKERPTSGRFTARVGGARLAIAFQNEAARIDLNAAPKELLVGLLVGLGASPFDAGGFADRIIAWRSKAAAGDADFDPETSLYRSAGLSFTPRRGPYAHVDELWLVYGVPAVLVERMLPFVTVFSGKAQVDVLDAAPQVVAALPGMTPETLQAILAAREHGQLDRTNLPGLLSGTGSSLATAEGSKAVRVGVRIDFENGRQAGAEAVILLPDDGPDPYRVLSWRNAFDGATDQPMDFGKR